MRSTAGFIALFDDDGHFVAGERWSDGNDECDGTARTAYLGPSVRCTAQDDFVPWCGPR